MKVACSMQLGHSDIKSTSGVKDRLNIVAVYGPVGYFVGSRNASALADLCKTLPTKYNHLADGFVCSRIILLLQGRKYCKNQLTGRITRTSCKEFMETVLRFLVTVCSLPLVRR